EVEGALAVLLREDQVRDLSLLLGVVEAVVQEGEEQRQRGQALLAVDDELLPLFVADDDGAEEVVAVVGNGAALVALLVALEELRREVGDQLGELLPLPLVLALVVVDRVLAAGEQLADGAALAVDLARGAGGGGHCVSGGCCRDQGPPGGHVSAALSRERIRS